MASSSSSCQAAARSRPESLVALTKSLLRASPSLLAATSPALLLSPSSLAAAAAGLPVFFCCLETDFFALSLDCGFSFAAGTIDF
jgi:hypothetical protein